MGKKLSQTRHDFNTTFDKLLDDAERGKLSSRLSQFYTRPLYYGTKLQKEVEDAKNHKRTDRRRDDRCP